LLEKVIEGVARW